MPRKINFFDGATSNTTPTIGNIVASSLVVYSSDADYEAAESGSPQAGNLYYNDITCKIRYYDSKAGVWKDTDNESLEAIAIIVAEQLVQDDLIAENAVDIDAIEVILADIATEIETLEILTKLLNNQDRNLATVGGGELHFGVGTQGEPAILDENSNSDGYSAVDGSAFTFVPNISGDLQSIQLDFIPALATVGTVSLELWLADQNSLPLSLIETTDSSDITTWNTTSNPTLFTLNNTVPILDDQKYVVVIVGNGNDGQFFGLKDDNETDSNGEILQFNQGTSTWEISSEPRDITFIASGIGSSTGAGVEIETDMYIRVPGLTNSANTIEAQSIAIANGEVAYIELNRLNDVPTVLPVTVGSVNTIPLTDNTLVIAERRNDIVYFGVNHTVALNQGETFRLDEGGGSGGGSKNRRLVGDSDLTLTITPESGGTSVGNMVDGIDVAGYFPMEQLGFIQTFLSASVDGPMPDLTISTGTPDPASVTSNGAIFAEIYELDGTGQPILGNVIGTSAVAIGDYSTATSYNPITLTFPTTNLVANTTYGIAVSPVTPWNASTNDIRIGLKLNDTYSDGELLEESGGSYVSSVNAPELEFEVGTPGPLIPESTALVIASDIYLQVEGLVDDRNTIEAQTITLGTEQVAYVIQNIVDETTVLEVFVDDLVNVTEEGIIIARKLGDKVIFGCPQTINIGDGQTFNLCENPSDNGQFDITDVLTGSIQGDSGSTSSTNQIVNNFQNITELGNTSMMNYDSTTGTFTVLKAGVFSATGSLNSTVGTTGARIVINGLPLSTENGSNNTFDSSASWSGYLNIGDTVEFSVQGSGSNDYRASLSAVISQTKTIVGGEISKSIIDPDDNLFTIQHTEAYNVDGGTKAAGDQIRVFNTELHSTTWGTLNTDDSFDLEAGKYILSGFATSYFVGRTFFSLLNNTDVTETNLVTCFATNSGNGHTILAPFKIKLTLDKKTNFHLNHFSQATRATNGTGVGHYNVAHSHIDNIYAQIDVLKIGDI